MPKYLIMQKKDKMRIINDDAVSNKLKKKAIIDFVPKETTSLTIDGILFSRKTTHYKGMDYITDNNAKYNFSYQELKNDYHRFKDMTDKQFVKNALDILHFCCFVSYLKELPTHAVLIDDGIIHELVHLLSDETKGLAMDRLDEIRNTFNLIMEIA